MVHACKTMDPWSVFVVTHRNLMQNQHEHEHEHEHIHVYVYVHEYEHTIANNIDCPNIGCYM